MTGRAPTLRRDPARACRAWVVALATLPLAAGSAHAQRTPASPEQEGALRGRLGIQAAERWLDSGEEADRLRAIERLGAIGSPRALDLLLRTLQPNGASAGKERLSAARALAPHATDPAVGRALARLLVAGAGASTADPGAEALDELVRGTAALALAAAATPEGLRTLVRSLRTDGAVAGAATLALAAHPPRNLEAVLKRLGDRSAAFVGALARLDDQRAFHALRSLVRQGSPEVQTEAALALTRLGSFETVPLARHWLERGGDDGRLLAAARILAAVHAPDAPAAIARLLARDATREAALQLSLEAPHPELVPALSRLLKASRGEDRELVLSALSRTGSDEAARLLGRELARGRAPTPAYLLARMPGTAARAELSGALRAARTRRPAARAAALRQVLLGERVEGLEEAVESLRGSGRAADRAAAASVSALLEPHRMAILLDSQDPAVIRCVARLSWQGGEEAALAAARRLASAPDPVTRTALAAVLAHPAAERRVPTRTLLQLVEEGGAAAPLGARALAARDDEAVRPHVGALLGSGDPLVRSHVALGLARSRQRDATGLLTRAYRFEPRDDVRLSIVIALSRRGGLHGLRTLELAERLDPAPSVRAAARHALSGRALSDIHHGDQVLWLEMHPSPSAGLADAVRHPAMVLLPSGVALPVVPDPDGLVLLAGLPEGGIQLRLAAAPNSGHAEASRGLQEEQIEDGRRRSGAR